MAMQVMQKPPPGPPSNSSTAIRNGTTAEGETKLAGNVKILRNSCCENVRGSSNKPKFDGYFLTCGAIFRTITPRMAPRPHDRAYALLIMASIAVFLLAGHFAATALLNAQRSRQLQLVNQLALRTSEAAVSFGAATLE